MGAINDLNRSDFPDILRRLRALEMGTPLNSASIGEGGLLVYDGGVITIENGGLDVTGTATISGTLSATGTIDMAGTFTATGDVNLNGPTTIAGDFSSTGDFKVTGPTHLNGPTGIAGDLSVTGQLDIKGASTLQSDLSVLAGGKVKVGSMTLDPGIAGGAVTFANGSQVFTDSTSIQLFKGNGAAQVSDSKASLSFGGHAVNVDADGVKLPALPVTTTQKPNLYADGAGKLYVSTTV